MTDPTIRYAEDNFEEVFLVGIRLGPNSLEGDLYSLVLYYEAARGDRNRPLTSEGRIVFFRDIAHANRALKLGDAAFRKYGKAPAEVACVYDVPAVLARVQHEDVDHQAGILDLLNELTDFVDATGRVMPEQYRQRIARFADWLTFDTNYSRFFLAHGAERTEILDAILWSIGAIVSQALMID